METQKYSPRWLLEKIKESTVDAEALLYILEFQKKLLELESSIKVTDEEKDIIEDALDFYWKKKVMMIKQRYEIMDNGEERTVSIMEAKELEQVVPTIYRLLMKISNS